MRNFAILMALAAGIFGSACSNLEASIVTGTYTLGGATTGSGPWNLTSTASPATFSVLRFVVDQTFTFADITDINIDYDSNLGGIGAGSPRAAIVFTDLTQILLHWGPAGSFADATIGNGLNTGNLAVLTDVGRYDLSGNGGSAYTDRAAALALVGSKTVNRISILLDSSGGFNQDFDISAVNVEIADNGVVPEPGSVAIWCLLGLAATGCSMWRQKEVA